MKQLSLFFIKFNLIVLNDLLKDNTSPINLNINIYLYIYFNETAFVKDL